MFPPPLYYRLRRSELVACKKLDAVLKEAYRKYYDARTETPTIAASPPENDPSVAEDAAAELPGDARPASVATPPPSFRPDVSFEGDELAEFFFPAPSEEVLDDFERFFLDDLRAIKAINAWQASQLAAGRVRFILGENRVVRQLGQGGCGQVFLGRPRSNPSNRASVVFGDDVAIKVLPLRSATPKATAKFLREVEISRLTEHKNLVRFVGAGRDASVHFAVYEYADAGDARRLLTRLERLDYRVAAYIVAEAAEGLAFMHSLGLVHRDVKPGNVLLTKSGEVKLGDFGFVSPIANFSPTEYRSPIGRTIKELERRLVEEVFQANAGDEEAQRTFCRQIQGTPDYLAPDQVKNPEEPSPLWDVYSLGCSLYLLLTGVVPFPSNNKREKIRAHFGAEPPEPSTFDASIPGELSRLTLQMMAKEPENRVRSAREIADALRAWVPENVRAEVAERRAERTTARRRKTGDNFWSAEDLAARFASRTFVGAGNGPDADSASDAFFDEARPSVPNARGTGVSPPPLPVPPNATPGARVGAPRKRRASVPPICRTTPELARRSRRFETESRRWKRAIELTIRYALFPASFILAALTTFALATYLLERLPNETSRDLASPPGVSANLDALR